MNIMIATVKHKKATRKNIQVMIPATRKITIFLELVRLSMKTLFSAYIKNLK